MSIQNPLRHCKTSKDKQINGKTFLKFFLKFPLGVLQAMLNIYLDIDENELSKFHVYVRVLFAKMLTNDDIDSFFSFQPFDSLNLGIFIKNEEFLLDDIASKKYDFIDYEHSVYSSGMLGEKDWRKVFSYFSYELPRIYLESMIIFLI